MWGKILKYSFMIVFVLFIAAAVYNFIPENPLPENAEFDRIVVEKSKRLLYGFYQGELIKTYKVSLGFDPYGHKQFEGDGKTPEGEYFINEKNTDSSYHLNLGVSYPNSMDFDKAERINKDPGGDIKIHGLKNGFCFIGKFHRFFNWTFGCIAVTCGEIEEIYRAMPMGKVIEIKK